MIQVCLTCEKSTDLFSLLSHPCCVIYSNLYYTFFLHYHFNNNRWKIWFRKWTDLRFNKYNEPFYAFTNLKWKHTWKETGKTEFIIIRNVLKIFKLCCPVHFLMIDRTIWKTKLCCVFVVCIPAQLTVNTN